MHKALGMESSMATLGKPENTINILKKYQFVFQKKYGQNFLIDTHVLDKIMKAADIGSEDLAIEVGPGIGTLTQYLCENAKNVAAIEIDDMLIPILNDTLSEYDNIEIIHDDVLKVDIGSVIEKYGSCRKVKVVANLPYYITTPIIMSLFESKVPIDSITVMVQKEVAERMQAKPGTKDYGALSLAVQYYADAKIVANVPPNCFMPRPNVGSAVIHLKKHETNPYEVKDEKLLFKIIRASFNQRRKTLQNGLKNAQDLPYSKDEILQAIRESGLDEGIRGEKLSLEQFVTLANILKQ